MNILFIGDVVGAPGRRKLIESITKLKSDYNIDFTIVNAENSAHGKGISPRIYFNFKNIGIDCLTLGNHAFAKKEILIDAKEYVDLLYPINMDVSENDLKSYKIYNIKGINIAVVSIMGEQFMYRIKESPFTSFGKLYDEIKTKCDLIIVDFHGEANGEKQLFAHYFKDKIAACIGTHTHVQTCDEQVIDGCAFISDVGMCGAVNSIIGRDIEEVILANIHKKRTHFKVAKGEALLSACVIEIDESTFRAKSIKRILLR